MDGFYDRIAADPALAGYFAGVDQTVLRGHQVDLLAAVAGGPQRYTGRQLAIAHAGLNITNAEFDRVMGHLNAALVEAGAADGTIRRVLTAVDDQGRGGGGLAAHHVELGVIDLPDVVLVRYFCPWLLIAVAGSCSVNGQIIWRA